MNRQMLLPHGPELQLVVTDLQPSDPSGLAPRDARGLEASCGSMSDGDFAALTTAAWCGNNGGMIGFDDSKRLFICPSYGQA